MRFHKEEVLLPRLNAWKQLTITNARAEWGLASATPQNVPRARVVRVQTSPLFLHQRRRTSNLKCLWLRDRCEPVKLCPLTPHLHGDNLFWPTEQPVLQQQRASEGALHNSGFIRGNRSRGQLEGGVGSQT